MARASSQEQVGGEDDGTVDGQGLGPVRSLAKGLAALDLLRAGSDLRSTDLASHLGIDKSAATRMLQTLVQAGYAERAQGRRYRQGEKLRGTLAPAAQHFESIRPFVQPLMASLSEQTREAVYLGMLVDGQVLYLDKVVPQDETLRVDRAIPTLSPLFCTAIGKVFVANLGIPVPPVLPAVTPNTITDPAAYAAQIEEVRRLGYAWDNEELNLGVRCVAAALRDRQGHTVAVICVTAPSARLPAGNLPGYGLITKRLADSYIGP